MPPRSARIASGVILGGLVAGAIDISYAILASGVNGVPADRVLQSVASGILGRAAYSGGGATAALGLALHFAMTLVMAGMFIAAARALPAIRQQLIFAGLIYGAAIYFAMRWVVVPLSAFPGDLRSIRPFEIVVHMIGVGLVIAVAGRATGAIPAPRPVTPAGLGAGASR